MIMTTRQLISIFLSSLVFVHPLQPGQWAGAGIVFAALYTQSFLKASGGAGHGGGAAHRKTASASGGGLGFPGAPPFAGRSPADEGAAAPPGRGESGMAGFGAGAAEGPVMAGIAVSPQYASHAAAPVLFGLAALARPGQGPGVPTSSSSLTS